MLKAIITTLSVILLFLGSVSGIVSLIYFAVELLNGVGFLAAAWSGLKVFGLGVASFVFGFMFLVTGKSMK